MKLIDGTSKILFKAHLAIGHLISVPSRQAGAHDHHGRFQAERDSHAPTQGDATSFRSSLPEPILDHNWAFFFTLNEPNISREKQTRFKKYYLTLTVREAGDAGQRGDRHGRNVAAATAAAVVGAVGAARRGDGGGILDRGGREAGGRRRAAGRRDRRSYGSYRWSGGHASRCQVSPAGAHSSRHSRQLSLISHGHGIAASGQHAPVGHAQRKVTICKKGRRVKLEADRHLDEEAGLSLTLVVIHVGHRWEPPRPPKRPTMTTTRLSRSLSLARRQQREEHHCVAAEIATKWRSQSSAATTFGRRPRGL
jgi:hypothetical protein